jgi:hypothetical protein
VIGIPYFIFQNDKYYCSWKDNILLYLKDEICIYLKAERGRGFLEDLVPDIGILISARAFYESELPVTAGLSEVAYGLAHPRGIVNKHRMHSLDFHRYAHEGHSSKVIAERLHLPA